MRHFSAVAWESRLDQAMRELDYFFEEKYNGRYTLHPARPRRGKTANPAHDGLISINANFTLGIGSEIGKGYVVDVKVVTLERVSDGIRDEIKDIAMEKLRQILPKYFPDTKLDISKDGPVLKIYGDLSLGEV